MNQSLDKLLDHPLVGGLEHIFFHTLGIIIPVDQYFSEGLKPPTSPSPELKTDDVPPGTELGRASRALARCREQSLGGRYVETQRTSLVPNWDISDGYMIMCNDVYIYIYIYTYI